MDPTPSERLAASETFLRASAQVSVINGLARLAGFARWIALGLALGTTFLGNTYQTANWIPNIVFDLVAGGVLSAVFVPTFIRELEHGRERGVEVASSLANTFLLLTVPVVVVGALAARPIMRAMTIGVADQIVRAQQVETGAWFLYIFLPQIPLYVLAMVFTGVLHAHRRFALPAAAPLFSSLVVIGSYLTFGALGAGADLKGVTRTQLWVLGGGTTAGVFVLAVSQLPSVLKVGVRWRPVLGWGDPAVRRAIRAGMYGVAFFAVTTVGLVVTLLLANRVEGGVVAFRVAFAFFELPKALIGLPIAVALLPALSERFARGDGPGYARLVSSGWRTSVFAAAPAAAGLFVLAPALSEAILGRAPTAAAPHLVGVTLRALALGIPAFVLVEPLARSFYARHETRSPVVANAAAVGLFAAFVVPFTLIGSPQGARGLEVIGIGTTVGQWLGVVVGAAILARRVRDWDVGADLRAGAANVLRAGVMAVIVWIVADRLGDRPEFVSIVGVGLGVAIYAALSLRSSDMKRTVGLLREARV